MVNAWEYSYNGLTFGGNTAYGVLEVTGITEPPDVREDISDKVGDHGGYSFMDKYSMRRVTLTGDLVDNATFEASVDALHVAFLAQVSPLPLVFDRPGFAADRRIYCKPSKLALPLDVNYQLGYGQWNVQLVAEDPFIYVDAVQTATILAGASASISNTGNIPTLFESVVITGPGTTFKFRDNLVGGGTRFIQLNLTLAALENVTVNFQKRTIIKNDGTNLYGTLDPTSQWWDIKSPNATPALVVTSGSTGATQAAMNWRSAWI